MNTSALKVVAISGLQPLDSCKQRLLDEINKMKPSRKETKTSKTLLGAIEDFNPKSDLDGLGRERCNQAVDERMARLKSVKGTLKNNQQRDLLVIIMFGVGKLSRNQRLDACALLKLGGSQENMKIVCDVFPGFQDVFRD